MATHAPADGPTSMCIHPALSGLSGFKNRTHEVVGDGRRNKYERREWLINFIKANYVHTWHSQTIKGGH